MFFKKALLKKNSKLKSLTIDSFAGGLNSVIDDAYLGSSTAKLSYNVVGDSGVLKENKGLVWFKKSQEKGYLPIGIENKKIKKAWYYKRFDNQTQTNDDQMVLLAEDNTLYALSLNKTGGAKLIDERPFNAIPYAVNYRLKGNDVIIFCSNSDDMRVYDGVEKPQVIVDAPKVSSMCIHYDRLFATTVQDKNTLVFSDDLDPTNWNIGIEEAGYITMTDDRGALVKVVSFLNNLYVFREYGISKLVAYGQQSSFSLSHLFLSTGKIMGDTVVVCGNTILFLTELGLYQFDGSNAKKILSNLDGYFEGVDNTHAQADFCDGKYYLTANLNFNDGMTTFAEKNCTNNAIVEVDLIKGSANFLRG
ncbi:MAG: hypothetical protein IKV38_00740, partial [Clostridia bacterium]|nr:hypothetical protein [Clostridia bacterium]